MDVLVPFSANRPKSRLSGVLSPDERVSLAHTMLSDVVEAVTAAGGDPCVLATEPVDVNVSERDDVPVVVDDRTLTTAVNDVLARGTPASESASNSNVDPLPVAVVMADLALATPDALCRLFDMDGDLVIAPGRGGGTNAIVVRHPEFHVDYHGASYLDHTQIAGAIGASVREVDSHRLASDIDEADDLVELLIHGTGRAAEWLREAGFELDASGGRAGVVRE